MFYCKQAEKEMSIKSCQRCFFKKSKKGNNPKTRAQCKAENVEDKS